MKYPTKKHTELSNQIRELEKQRNKLNAVTVDGVPIEVGMTLYTADAWGLEKIVVPENVFFKEDGFTSGAPLYLNEDYSTLYVDLEKAKEACRKSAVEDVERAKKSLKYSRERLRKVEKAMEIEIAKWETE